MEKESLMKKWFVRIFFRFWVERDALDNWRIIVKPPIKSGAYMLNLFFPTKSAATRRMAEIRKDGAFLYCLYKWN